jgi:CRP-like cAMP-binding protein
VAILQPLAERLWDRTAAPPVPGRAVAPYPGTPNADLRFHPYERDPGTELGGIPIPVLRISPQWLADWALLVTGSTSGVSTAIISTHRPVPPGDPVAREHDQPVRERVRRFQAAASPEAVRLAAHIAVSVPTLPIMRLIQHRFVPGSDPGHLAEVILSGLLRPHDARAGAFEFVPGARERLLSALPRSEAWHAAEVLTGLSDEIAARAGTTDRLFRAYVIDPHGTADDRPVVGDRPFALVDETARRLIDRVAVPLRAGAAPPPAHADTSSPVEPDTQSDRVLRLVLEEPPAKPERVPGERLTADQGEGEPEVGIERFGRGSFIDELPEAGRQRVFETGLRRRGRELNRLQEPLLYRQGERAGEVAVLLSGFAHATTTSPAGVATTLDLYGPGDILGLESLFGRLSPTTIAAEGPTDVSLFRPREFAGALHLSASARPALELLLERLEYAFRRRAMRSRLTGVQCVEWAIDELADRFDERWRTNPVGEQTLG